MFLYEISSKDLWRSKLGVIILVNYSNSLGQGITGEISKHSSRLSISSRRALQ